MGHFETESYIVSSFLLSSFLREIANVRYLKAFENINIINIMLMGRNQRDLINIFGKTQRFDLVEVIQQLTLHVWSCLCGWLPDILVAKRLKINFLVGRRLCVSEASQMVSNLLQARGHAGGSRKTHTPVVSREIQVLVI